MKTFDGQSIEVQVGTGSTLFVTNFPPTADENYIREMFERVSSICCFAYRAKKLMCYSTAILSIFVSRH